VTARTSGAIEVASRLLPRDAVFLLDGAIQARSHGAGVFGADGALLGLASAARVAVEVGEPTLADLLRPSSAS
jgi:hypothetical protein